MVRQAPYQAQERRYARAAPRQRLLIITITEKPGRVNKVFLLKQSNKV